MPVAERRSVAFMKNGIAENGVCPSESANGNRDVWSSKESESSSADHLVIMVHGIMGTVADWKFGAEQFVKTLPDKVIVHCNYKVFKTTAMEFEVITGGTKGKKSSSVQVSPAPLSLTLPWQRYVPYSRNPR
ncbi:hypothetical protein ACFX2K_031795 [Malus domestica]